MIFIIIAVTVLFISFIIALISLVREQKKIEKVEESEAHDNTNIQPSVMQNSTIENNTQIMPENPIVDAEVREHISEPQQPLVEHEDRFPWETEPRTQNTQSSEQDEIEKIRAEIANMKKPSGVQEDAPVPVQQPIETDDKIEDTRLRGEFQIRRDD